MIIDTNIYRGYTDGNKVIFAHLDEASAVLVPLAVMAEIKAGFVMGTRYTSNMRQFEAFLASSQVRIVMPNEETTDYYAQAADYCRCNGRVLSNNDLWIAATALETGERLLTCDRDFAVFQDYPGMDVVIV